MSMDKKLTDHLACNFKEGRVNERIDHQIQTNRDTYESLLTNALQSHSINLCSASVTLQQTIRYTRTYFFGCFLTDFCFSMLQQQLRCNPATAELGVELFYYIMSLLTDEIISYPPTKSLFSGCLEKLGQVIKKLISILNVFFIF